MIRTLGRLTAAARAHGLGSQLRAVRDALDSPFVALGVTPLCVSVGGVTIGGFLRHRSFLAELRDDYEPFARELFCEAARSADVILDVGSHTGLYSLLAVRENPVARVVAVEADPYNAAALRRNVRGTRVSVVQKAAADADGRALFQQNLGTIGSSLIDRPGTGPRRAIEVETTTIDALADSASSLLLKLDVEGAERRALAGAESLLSSAERATVLLELNPRALAAAGESSSALVQTLTDFGLDLHFIDEERHELVPLIDLERKGNLLATKGYVAGSNAP